MSGNTYAAAGDGVGLKDRRRNVGRNLRNIATFPAKVCGGTVNSSRTSTGCESGLG